MYCTVAVFKRKSHSSAFKGNLSVIIYLTADVRFFRKTEGCSIKVVQKNSAYHKTLVINEQTEPGLIYFINVIRVNHGLYHDLETQINSVQTVNK